MNNMQGKTKSASGESKQKQKTYLYIDGTNLLAGLVELLSLKNIPRFSSILEIIGRYYCFQRIYFYASYTPISQKSKPRDKKYAIKEFEFFREVKNTSNLIFFKGYRSPTSKKEKGVDVHLAVDLVKDAFLNKYQRAIIISGDADLTYTAQVVKSTGKEIVAAFLINRFSRGIAYEVESGLVLNYEGKFKISLGKLPRKIKIVKIKTPACKHTG